MQQTPSDHRLVPPQPGAVLVLERCDSWVRVLDPVSGVSGWIDLGEGEYETVASGSAAACESNTGPSERSPSAGEAAAEAPRPPISPRLTRDGGTA